MKVDNTKNKEKSKLLTSPNPIAMASAGLSGAGTLMPDAIHGGIMQEDSNDVQFIDNLRDAEIKDILSTSKIENSRFEIAQFEKYYGQSAYDWCCLQDEQGNCLAIAVLEINNPSNGYVFVSEIQNLKKGYGKPLFQQIFDKYGKVWFMANPEAGKSLVDYYVGLGFDHIQVDNSIWGGELHFFCTKSCDIDMLNEYCMKNYTENNDVVTESLKKESSIDYPVSEGLCPQVWDEVEDGKYILNPDIKMKALELVDKLLAKYHVEAKGVNVVGSICSNQYTEDGDVDIHIQVDLPENVVEKLNNLRKKTQDEILGSENLLVGGSHPLEFYFQSNLYADMGSCGCYDIMNDKWLSGPQLVDLEFDPYDEYEESWDYAFVVGERAQSALFKLATNLYKYNAILDQASNRDVYSNEQLMSLIGRRLEQVSDDISQNLKSVFELKEEMVQIRRRGSLKPKNEQEAEEMRTNKEWQWLCANSTFKFLQRLGVLDQVWLAATLWKAIEIGDITIQDAIFELNKDA